MMKRPDINDYLIVPNVKASVKQGYYMDLEKYCDELEKALDKACRELTEKDIENAKDSLYMQKYKVWSKEQWKEWIFSKSRKRKNKGDTK